MLLPKMDHVYIRRRPREKLPGSFVEIFLEPAFKSQLRLPTNVLARFEGRESCAPKTIESQTLNGSSAHFVLHFVDSDIHKKPTKRKLQDILAHGAWIAYYDTVPCFGLPRVSSFFGVPIHDNVYALLYNGIRAIYKEVPWPDCLESNDPYVVYHGTSREAVKSILAEELRSTWGMLGQAIYFGSFWKAFRFATLTQDYKKRRGAILRCYAFWNRVHIRNDSSCPCVCDKCIQKNTDVVDSIPDHLETWHELADAVLAWPNGKSLKNEEWATKDMSCIIIDSVAHAEAQTEHHEAFNRSLAID